MGNYFSYYQKCKKHHCNFYSFFKIPLNSYDDYGKTIFGVFCLFCKMVTFSDFEKAAYENAIFYLKRRQFVVRLIQKIKDEKTRWEDLKRTKENFKRLSFD